MADSGALNGKEDRAIRVITKVVISYYLQDAPDTKGTLTIAHGGDGEIVDGVIWGGELMRKIAYLEGEECREPKKAPGTGEWKTYAREGEATQDSGAQEASAQEATAQTTTKATSLETMTLAATGDAGTSGEELRTECIWLHNEDCTWSEYCTGE